MLTEIPVALGPDWPARYPETHIVAMARLLLMVLACLNFA
jgi:hypothetical protein